MCQLSVNTGFYATVNTGFNNNYNNLMEYKEFANRLKSLQLEKGIKTQIELSRWLGFSRSIVSEWMRGECLPSMDTAIKLSEKFGCNAQWLLTGKGKKTIDEEIITQGFLESANLTNEQIALIKSMVTQFEQNNPKSSENKENKDLNLWPRTVGGRVTGRQVKNLLKQCSTIGKITKNQNKRFYRRELATHLSECNK
jgi:transcriptional regulator with XRE-family HTH domain